MFRLKHVALEGNNSLTVDGTIWVTHIGMNTIKLYLVETTDASRDNTL
jgi:hypothetical protein